MSRVAAVACGSYNDEEVIQALRKAVDSLGGMKAFIKEGEKILLKPNLLAGDPPEKCVTTHPSVFYGTAVLAKEAGAHLSYGDSPGITSMETAAKKSEIAAAAEKAGIEPADFVSKTDVHNPQGIQNKRFTIAQGVKDSDGIISICKMKTHALEKYTGAVKNQFGCIPGTLKAEYHVKLPGAYEFARMLLDLNFYIKPRLYVMDAVYAMEGNGPRGGTPVKTGCILVSDDPVALDAAACRIMNLDPELVPVIKLGREYTEPYENTVYTCSRPEEFLKPDFDVDRSSLTASKSSGFLVKFAGNRWLPKPVIDMDRCLRCGICVRACPVKPAAVDWKKGNKKKPPVYDYGRCIRCFCCQEMCPEKAVRLKKPLLRRLFRK